MNDESIIFNKIGTLYSPCKEKHGVSIQPKWAKGIRGKIVIEPEYTEGLKDLQNFSHIYLICYLHQSKGYNLTVTPPIDNKPHGVFATRSPNRPNPIGLSVVKLISVEKNILKIENVDLLDETPVLDIKPYSPTFDTNDVFRFGWIED